MNYSEFEKLLCSAFRQNNIKAPDEEQTKQFFDFTNHLLDVGERMNLTALKTVPEIVAKHYADSLLAIESFPDSKTVLDVGCGAGFPSIPLAIMRSDLKISALDSTAKKIRFVESSIELLRLKNIRAIAGRAEDADVRRKIGKVDIVVSRAVARLNILVELCLPFLKAGGAMVALKGAKGEEEFAEAQNAIKKLGGEAKKITCRDLETAQGVSEQRTVIEIQKIAPTPPQYPRPFAQIIKKPL